MVYRSDYSYLDKVVNDLFASTEDYRKGNKSSFSNPLDYFFPLMRTESSPHFPPYNIYNQNEKTVLELACAGFSKNDLGVYVEDGCLVVEGKQATSKKEAAKEKTFYHRGIASRNFKVSYPIHSDYEVDEVSFDDGILKVSLKRKESLPPKRLKYNIS